MTQYQVDADAVFTATTAIRASAARLQTEVSTLISQMTNLQSSWTGQAAMAFQAVVSDWHATQQRVEESLAALNQALTRAGQQYAETEQVNLRMFSG